MCSPVTESREYGNPIPSQNASLSNNYNITSAVHNCTCALQFAERTLRTADMLTLFCKLHKTKNFEEIPERFLVYRTRGKNLT